MRRTALTLISVLLSATALLVPGAAANASSPEAVRTVSTMTADFMLPPNTGALT